MRKTLFSLILMLSGSLLLNVTGCSVKDADEVKKNSNENNDGGLSGSILVDGSSTVFPATQAVAEEFGNKHKNVKVTVGTSGTGGGFKKWVLGETDINDASRPIKSEEAAKAKENKIEFLELKVGIDGLTVVVNSENTWCKSMTVEQLRKLWEPNSSVQKWSDLDESWPDEDIMLYGPDTESGTFDYFTEEICGETGAIRADYQPSTDDNTLVQGVSGNKYALGYFGYAYFVENKDKLKAVAIVPKSGGEPVMPTDESIESGAYTPLSRPLYIYITDKALERSEVQEFLRFYLSDEGQGVVASTGYIKLNKATQAAQQKALEDAIKD